jgi:hypothetical protein
MTASERATTRRARPSKLSLWLILLFLLNALVINWSLPRLPWQPQFTTTLDYTQAFFKRGAHSDSWKPMRTALFFVDEPRKKPLYTVVFFDNNVRFQYPPSSLLILEGLRALPIDNPIGNDTLNDISWWSILLLAGAVARIFYLARRRFGNRPASTTDEFIYVVLALLFTLSFYPVVRGYYLGQIQIWIDLLLAGVLWAWLEDRKRIAGVLFSFICVIKPTLALLAVWAVLRRQWHFVVGFAVPMACFAMLSLALYGWDNHVDYLGVLSYISRQGEIFHPNQSMNGLLHRLLDNGNSLEWNRNTLMLYNPWVHAGTVASSLALLGFGLWAARAREVRLEPLDLAIVLLCSALAAPTAWTHHYGVTLLLFALALPAILSIGTRARHGIMLGLLIAFLLISNNYRALNRLHDTPLNFLQSYVYFGGLLLLATLWRTHRALRTPDDQPAKEPRSPRV